MGAKKSAHFGWIAARVVAVTTNNRPQEGATAMTHSPITYTGHTALALVRESAGNHAQFVGIDTGLFRMALQIAIDGKKRMVQTMSDVAAALRAGQQIAIFADGEDGARAADHLCLLYTSPSPRDS